MKKKSLFLFVLLILNSFNGFSLDFHRVKAVGYSGTSGYNIIAWGAAFFFGLCWPENHNYTWNVSITANGNLCYENNKKLYVNRGTNISVSSSINWAAYVEQVSSSITVKDDSGNTYSTNVEVYEKLIVEYHMSTNNSGDRCELKVEIIPVDSTPLITFMPENEYKKYDNDLKKYFNKPVTYTLTKLPCNYSVQSKENTKKDYSTSEELSENGTYEFSVEDVMGNKVEDTIFIDTKKPVIKVFTDDKNKEVKELKNGVWFKEVYNSFKVIYSDDAVSSGLLGDIEPKVFSGEKEESIEKSDKAGNTTVFNLRIDYTPPKFDETIVFSDNNKINLSINNLYDAMSGLNKVSIIKNLNGGKENKDIFIEDSNKHINQTVNYPSVPLDREIDNELSFDIAVTDVAGSTKTKNIGPYIVPKKLRPKISEDSDKYVKLTFNCTNDQLKNYTSIKVKRIFDGLEKKDFDQNVQSEWDKLTENPFEIKSEIKVVDGKCVFTDKSLKGSGFTHKKIEYEVSYEYVHPVDSSKRVTEVFETNSILLSNTSGSYSLKLKGSNNTYAVFDSSGNAKTDLESFEMPNNAVVGVYIKATDDDIEPYEITVQGKASIKSSNGQFTLKKIDTSCNLFTNGAIAGVSGYPCNNNTKKLFSSSQNQASDSDGWIYLGEYPLQYNVYTVFEVVLKQGFPYENRIGETEEKSENIKVFAKAPTIAGGKARLCVDDGASYSAEGITARPGQPFSLEIEMFNGNNPAVDWDFGNDFNSNKFPEGYKKISDYNFKDVYYNQSPARTGAISEYILKIKIDNEEENFKVNILDTQFGTLYTNEVWRGEHIIKGPVIIPAGKTLTIGDQNNSLSDSDIQCLCLASSIDEDCASIIVEKNGELVLEEGNTKTITFVQAKQTEKGFEEVPSHEYKTSKYWKGITVKGNLSGDNLRLSRAKNGLYVDSGATVELSSIDINDCEKTGIKLSGELTAASININEQDTTDTIERGIVLLEGSTLKINDILQIKNCVVGLHLFGQEFKAKNGFISDCKEYGIKVDGNGIYDYKFIKLEKNGRNEYLRK